MKKYILFLVFLIIIVSIISYTKEFVGKEIRPAADILIDRLVNNQSVIHINT